MSKKANLARFGIFTRGIVYTIVGGLTAYTAFSSGSGAKGSDGALKFVSSQPAGQILLGAVVLGLLAFVGWRLYLAFSNPEGDGDTKKEGVKRAAYFVSALSYLSLAVFGINLLLSGSSSGGSSWLSKILDQSWGKYVVIFIALCLLGKAIYEIYRAWSGKFKEKIQNSEMDHKAQEFLIKSGKWGLTARGLVVGVISYLFLRAALSNQAGQAGGTKDAFKFIQEQGGMIAMGVVATGLILYGIYQIACSRYRNIPVS
ncbi:MAG: DUF1206 domain-containing protein [Nonlabens sp.]